MKVGLLVVGLIDVGLLVMVGWPVGLMSLENLEGITSNALPGYSHAMAKLSLPPPSFMRALTYYNEQKT